MSTYRQQILDDIAGRLLLIRPGYTFHLPDGPYVCQGTINEVKPWRKNPYQLPALPAIAYRDGIVEIIPGMQGQDKYLLKIIMAVYLQGTTASSQARKILQDMAAAVGFDPRCGNLAERTDLEHAALNMYQGADIVAGGRLAFTVTYVPVFEAGSPEPEDNVLTAGGEELTAGGETLTW